MQLIRIFAAALLALAACESATNLNVSYTPVTDGGPDATTNPPEFAGCPCDTSAGLGCCLTKSGTPFCTTSIELCKSQKAMWLECAHPSGAGDSDCCWHGPLLGGQGSLTSYRGECDGGVRACSSDDQCPTNKCSKQTCNNVTIGACGDKVPDCP